MQIIPLAAAHLEPAARLFVRARRQARALVPALSCPDDDADTIAARLADLLPQFPGAVALENGAFVGYLTGFALPEFMSARRGVYCPEWAHGAQGERRAETYRRLYAALSPLWADNGCYTHAVTLLAHDADARDGWFRGGFGLNGVDAVRDLTPQPPCAPDDLLIHRAAPGDAGRLLSLAHDLQRHLADGPTFVPLLEFDPPDELAAWLADPDHALWFAEHEGAPIAFLRCQTAEHEQRHIVSGADGIAISGAYTAPAWRGTGVASRLLDHALTWARERGLTRCSVDFESQNGEADRFWRRHFTPVCYSLLRRVDERVAWANRRRPAEAF